MGGCHYTDLPSQGLSDSRVKLLFAAAIWVGLEDTLRNDTNTRLQELVRAHNKQTKVISE